jgi:uncharacterized protein
MQRFYQTHYELLDSVNIPIHRGLLNEIDWRNRLIGIKGSRGIGKTIFLLDVIKSRFGSDKACLYLNLNNLYFSKYSLVKFADEFRKTGGKMLVLDQVFKYPDWSQALREIYDRYPDLQVVFTGSPVMRLKDDNPDLKGKVTSYQLRGLSFREFLNYTTGQSFSSYTLPDILQYHVEIAKDILFKVKPLAYFNDYLQKGFYPFFIDRGNFREHLIKIVNLTLEIDIPYLQQMELKYLPNLKKLTFELAENMPHTPNVSQLSNAIDTSRATVVNYLKYLRNARIINMIYNGEADFTKKPDRVYMQNPNLLYAIAPNTAGMQAYYETFFLNQMNHNHTVSSNGKRNEFLVNNEMVFKIGSHKRNTDGHKNTYTVLESDEVGLNDRIPLWLFGFIY